MYIWFYIKQIVFVCLIVLITYVSTLLSEWESIQKRLVFLCVVDNATHILLAIVSWLIVISYEKLTLYLGFQSLMCGIFSGLLDVDHFLMARSWRLKDAVSLDSRPPFHNTSYVLLCSVAIIVVAHRMGYRSVENSAWIFMVAAISHHLWDALRRGIWISPWETKPLSFTEFLLLSYLFPLAIGSLLKIISPSLPKTKSLSDVWNV